MRTAITLIAIMYMKLNMKDLNLSVGLLLFIILWWLFCIATDVVEFFNLVNKK